MIGELRQAKEKQPFKMVFFVDDDFISDKEWLREFLELYKRDIGVLFRCAGCARNVDDEVATMLAASESRLAFRPGTSNSSERFAADTTLTNRFSKPARR